MRETKADVVIIGSGISGLTAAALLAKHGRKVVVLEQGKRSGGALKRFKRGKIPFDVGFHYSGGLGRGEMLRVLWEYLGVWARITVHAFPADGNDFIHFKKSGRAVRSFFSYDLLKDELINQFPAEEKGIGEYLQAIKDLCGNVPFYNLQLPLTPFLREAFYPAGQGLTDKLLSYTQNEELLAVLASPVLLYGVSPRLASVSMHAVVAHGFYSGAYAVEGGGQAIVDAYIKVLDGHGAEVISGCKADRLVVEDGRVKGVICDQGHISAEQVIYTGHPARLFDLLDEKLFRPAYAHRLRDLQDTASMFIVFGAVDNPQKLADLTWVNYYQIPEGLDILDVSGKKTAETALLITAPGGRDILSAPASGADRGVILMKPADWHEAAPFSCGDNKKRRAGYNDWKEKVVDEMMAQALTLWGGSAHITPLEAGTPLTFRDELGSPQGGIYGVQHNKDQFTPSARTKLPGLMLSGQNTLMAGVMGAALAGLVTAAEIEGIESLWEKVLSSQ